MALQNIRTSWKSKLSHILRIWRPARHWRRSATGKDEEFARSSWQSAAFHLLLIAAPLIALRIGCVEPYRIPAGGGSTAAKRMSVKFKRVKRKKYIINPLSPIFFTQPKLEEIDLRIDEDTTHAYSPGQIGGAGKGKGRGFGGGLPGGKIRFIRLEYRGGDWDQDMGLNADVNMLIEFNRRTGIPVKNHTESVSIHDIGKFPKNRKPPFIYITGARGIDIGRKGEGTLRDYLLRDGGMLFADNGGGYFDNSFKRLLRRALPEYDLVRIPFDDEVFLAPYVLPDGAPPLWHHSGNEALGIRHKGRWVVFYHQGDIGDAWKSGHSGTSAESTELAYRAGVNVIQYAVTKYLRHIGALNE